jgi:pectin methylesterase-like acyl-CoA thioesterase
MDKYPLIRKCLAVGIILFFITTCITPVNAQDITKPTLLASSGKWLYVGGSEPGNNTKIQDAIDNASNGDTVFVYSGIYYENIDINKSIDVFGQDKETTIIEGKLNDNIDPIITYDFVMQPVGIAFSRYNLFGANLLEEDEKAMELNPILKKLVNS